MGTPGPGTGLATVITLRPDQATADVPPVPLRRPVPRRGPEPPVRVLVTFLAALVLAGGSGWIAGTYGFGVLLDLALAVVAACLLTAIVGLPYAHARGWLR
jgi:hypothetical protein